MSGSSYDNTSKGTDVYRGWSSRDDSVRLEVKREHSRVVEEARSKIDRGEAVKPPKVNRDVREITDSRLARNVITHPSPSARRVVVVLVDNSGSNRKIADHLKTSSGYLMSFLRTVDPDAEIAFVYFSDHRDGPRCLQYSDFVAPTPVGDKVLFNSLERVEGAHGHDEPEAIECALHDAAQINFAHVPVADRTLILVTDSVAHGMGNPEDDGCPDQRSWRKSMEEVRKSYGKFVLVGSGSNKPMADIQRKFFETSFDTKGNGVSDETDIARNFIDLSDIESSDHRNGIVGNSILFVMARNTGKQGIPVFLAGLYAKWLQNPIFGTRTDELARTRISAFARLYLPGVMTSKEIESMLKDIFAD